MPASTRNSTSRMKSAYIFSVHRKLFGVLRTVVPTIAPSSTVYWALPLRLDPAVEGLAVKERLPAFFARERRGGKRQQETHHEAAAGQIDTSFRTLLLHNPFLHKSHGQIQRDDLVVQNRRHGDRNSPAVELYTRQSCR